MKRGWVFFVIPLLALWVYFARHMPVSISSDEMEGAALMETVAEVPEKPAVQPVEPTPSASLPVQPGLPADGNAAPPFDSCAKSSSARAVKDLFHRAEQRKILNRLGPDEQKRLVKLKSRFFTGASPGAIDLSSLTGNEFYLTFAASRMNRQKQNWPDRGYN